IVYAASSYVTSNSSSTGLTEPSMYGKVTNKCASKTPAGANIGEMPSGTKSCPRMPIGPHSSSRDVPTTTVGIATGKLTTTFNASRPGKRYLDSTYAVYVPNTPL